MGAVAAVVMGHLVDKTDFFRVFLVAAGEVHSGLPVRHCGVHHVAAASEGDDDTLVPQIAQYYGGDNDVGAAGRESSRKRE